MTEITYETSKPDPITKKVTVTFKNGDATYTRDVNAVYMAGKYDKSATDTRVKEVLAGVAAKLNAGVVEFLTDAERAAREAEAQTPPVELSAPTTDAPAA